MKREDRIDVPVIPLRSSVPNQFDCPILTGTTIMFPKLYFTQLRSAVTPGAQGRDNCGGILNMNRLWGEDSIRDVFGMFTLLVFHLTSKSVTQSCHPESEARGLPSDFEIRPTASLSPVQTPPRYGGNIV